MKRHARAQQFLSAKREKRRLKLIAEERQQRKESYRRAAAGLLHSPATLRILQKHIPKRTYAGKDRKETIPIPRVFSIVDGTESALETIYKLVAISKRARPPREIFFDHSALVKFDLTAEAILDIVAIDFKRTRRLSKGGLRLSGMFPIDAAANRFIRAVGIIKNLELSEYYLRREEEQDLRILREMSYRALLRVSEESPSERAARRLVDYFNECLLVRDLELTQEGRHQLAIYAGEVLDNAVQHSGAEDWVLVGYLDLSTPEQVCEISIFNFGKSYADTFLELPSEHFMRQYVDPFVDLHRKKGFFGRGWEPDNLLTVVALQGQVSSKNETDQDTRGNGTIDLVNFFQGVHTGSQSKGMQNARMVIISGRTRILFDGTHKMDRDANGRAIIAFNSANNLEIPPVRTHVECLERVGFPGTIVSIRFPLLQGATRHMSEKNEH